MGLYAQNALCVCIVLISSVVCVAQDIFFICDNRKIYAIDENTLKINIDEQGELAVKLRRFGTLGIGLGTEEDPIVLGVSGRYFGRFLLTLLRNGEIEFPSRADAQNTLAIAKQLGLPKAQIYLENYISSKSFCFANNGFNALSLLFANNKNTGLEELAQLVLDATRANDLKLLKLIYDEKMLDVDFLIPSKNHSVMKAYLKGNYGSPVLSYAASAGNVEAARLFLSYGANPAIHSIYSGSSNHKSVLVWAQQGGNKKLIRLIKRALKKQEVLSQ